MIIKRQIKMYNITIHNAQHLCRVENVAKHSVRYYNGVLHFDPASLKTHMKATGDDILSDTTEDTPVDTILLRLTNAIEEGTNKFIPTRMTKTKEGPPWISLEIRRLLRKQWRLFEKQKGSAYASRASQH